MIDAWDNVIRFLHCELVIFVDFYLLRLPLGQLRKCNTATDTASIGTTASQS